MLQQTLTKSLTGDTINIELPWLKIVVTRKLSKMYRFTTILHHRSPASMATFNEAHLISLGSSGIASILNTRIETFSSMGDLYSG